MALSRLRRRQEAINYWPGFVDVLSTLLLVITFLMSLFMVMQFFASREASGKDAALSRLNAQISSLTELLALERGKSKASGDDLAALTASLRSVQGERDRLIAALAAEGEKAVGSSAQLATVTADADAQKRVSNSALAQVELLNQQIAALRRQIAALEGTLDTSERRDRDAQARIADLGQRLNVALAQRVQELSRYRSDFFGELRKVIGERDDIQIVGDRFVFQAEVFFDSGSADINPAGLVELDKLAAALVQLERQIPGALNWVLRIDGHTDNRPIATAAFPSNWELSSARAISVVKYLMTRGVPADRLVAAGFGEYQPLAGTAAGGGEEELRRNRRLELKLTEK